MAREAWAAGRLSRVEETDAGGVKAGSPMREHGVDVQRSAKPQRGDRSLGDVRDYRPAEGACLDRRNTFTVATSWLRSALRGVPHARAWGYLLPPLRGSNNWGYA